MFGQTFDLHDLILIAILVVLEGVLSIDNALVLGLLARRLPKRLQHKALTYGLVGALVFRLLAVATAAWLLHWRMVKLLGGLYLLWVAVKHFAVGETKSEEERLALDDLAQPILLDTGHGKSGSRERPEAELPSPNHARGGWGEYAPVLSTYTRAFWFTVGAIELTDIAFAVDSIVAAIGVVGPAKEGHRHPKLWVVLVGGMLGVVLMRFAAIIFIKLLERFPRFETSAYLLVTVIGAKLVADYLFNSAENPDRLNLHSPGSFAFWIFWLAMAVAFAFGFLPPSKPSDTPAQT